MHDYVCGMMQFDFSDCLVLNTRMAARAVTRRADKMLRPFGITAAQFNILGSFRAEGLSITALAESIAMERSTLSRNLQLLESKGLVAAGGAGRGHGRIYRLTPTGETLIAQVEPVWQASQAELRQTLTDPDFATIIDALRQVARL